MPIDLASPPAQCVIEPSANGARTILTATVAGMAEGGLYQFEIRAVSPDGSSSTNMQGGEIDAGQAERKVLGKVLIGHPVRFYAARLVIYTPAGSPVCSTELP